MAPRIVKTVRLEADAPSCAKRAQLDEAGGLVLSADVDGVSAWVSLTPGQVDALEQVLADRQAPALRRAG